jgi:hypothetical protein
MSWWEEVVKTPDAAGTVGAVLGFLSAPGGTRRQQIANLAAGVGCALFVAPFVAERAGMQSQPSQMAFAFIIGLIGMNIVPKLLLAAERVDWLARFLPSKGGKP